MNNSEIKKFIAERVAQGISLSKIQDALLAEHNVKMTFLELRMLASELENTDWTKLDKPEQKSAEPPAAPAAEETPEEEELLPDEPGEPAEAPDAAEKTGKSDAVRGKTTVEVSKLAMPGTVMNGSVKFGSGVTAEWYLDQMGRLGLGKVAGGKPDETDVEEFQNELRKLLGE